MLLGDGVMGTIVIAFPRLRSGKWAGDKSPLRGRKRPELKTQFDRIAALLDELECLTGGCGKQPPTMLTQARNSVLSARHALELRDDIIRAAPWDPEPDGDPQPHVDHEALERLFNIQDKDQ